MRYLKATAQDRTGNGIADTVILHFYERCSTGVDELVHEAFAVDLNVDDVVDLQCSGDINSDGKINIIDTYFLKAFANSFLRLSWFNRGESWLRTLVVAAIQNQKEGPPNGVQLNFLERRSAIRKPILTYQAAISRVLRFLCLASRALTSGRGDAETMWVPKILKVEAAGLLAV